ncbi:MAG TPA: hypothetical protein VGE69_05700 [Pseudomonadales bacterium]
MLRPLQQRAAHWITRRLPSAAIGRKLSLAGTALLGVLLASCAANTINISGSYPSPLVRKIPITVGVYYPEELRNFSFTEIDDYTGDDQYIVNSGETQIELFNTVLPALFENVVMLDSLENRSPELDAVFVPAIEEFQLGLPQKTKLKVYEVWVKYNMRLEEPEGEYIADWVMTAYGKSPTESFQSVDAGVQDATVVALRDLAASFTLGFSGIPEVNEWLAENSKL